MRWLKLNKPHSINSRFDWLGSGPVAHRGLFSKAQGIPENSMPAVDAAIKAGVGIEIDVRLTLDERVVVFHDKDLERMTGQSGLVSQTGFTSLTQTKLSGSDAFIPSLVDVLDHVGGQVPVLIEAKTDFHPKTMSRLMGGVRHALEGYNGPCAVMSFDPAVPLWLKNNAPNRCRGLIYGDKALESLKNRLKLQMAIHKGDPDFLAVDVRELPNKICSNWRARQKPVYTWTVRTPEQEQTARDHADAPIFEIPAVLAGTTE